MTLIVSSKRCAAKNITRAKNNYFPVLIMELSILQWNCRSLVAHQAELKNYLSSTTVRPSLICVQETFLKPGKNVNIHGYVVERRDREGAKRAGGVAIFIAEGLSYTVIDRPEDVEALTIQFSLASKRKITVTCLYHPPATAINPASFRRIFALKDNIIVGDLNSHSTLWGSPTTDNNGRLVEELLEEHDLTVLNTGEGTFVKPNSEGYSPLDLTIVPGRLEVPGVRVHRCTHDWLTVLPGEVARKHGVQRLLAGRVLAVLHPPVL